MSTQTTTTHAAAGGEGFVPDHEFKSHPSVFWPAVRGEKTFEYRRDDRGGYYVGQTVRLRCYDAGSAKYLPEQPLDRVITNILRGGEFELPAGYCILSLAPLTVFPASPPTTDLAARFEAKREECEAMAQKLIDASDQEEAYWHGRAAAFTSARDMARADAAGGAASEPVAWAFEYRVANGEGVWEHRVALHKPCDGHWLRNVRPLFEVPAPAQQGSPPQPAGAERVDMGELERLSKAAGAYAEAAAARHAATMAYHAAWDEQAARGVQPRDMDLAAVGEASRKAQGAESLANVELCSAATALVPPSLAPALVAGEGSGSAGWMPIETAPKDGTKFDAWAVHPATGSMGVRFADVQARGDETGFGVVIHQPKAHWEYLEQDGPTYPAWKLTHWRPRPDSPSPLPHPQAPNTLSEVEEARTVLEGMHRALLDSCKNTGSHAEQLRILNRAAAVEASIDTLRASQEQDGEVRDA